MKLNLQDLDLHLVNSIFARREEDINIELEGIDFDIDFGCFEIQKKFYAKYIVIKNRDYEDERDKEKFLKVQVNLDSNTHLYLTQQELSDKLTKFRLIYEQSTRVKSFLVDQAISFFNEKFKFEIFLLVEEELPFDLQIENDYNEFKVYFQEGKNDENDNSDDLIEPICKQNFLKNYINSCFKKSLYAVVKTVTNSPDISQEKINEAYLKKYHAFFEYLLKNKSLVEDGKSAKIPNFDYWKS